MKFKMKFIKIKINESNRLNDYKSRQDYGMHSVQLSTKAHTGVYSSQIHIAQLNMGCKRAYRNTHN